MLGGSKATMADRQFLGNQPPVMSSPKLGQATVKVTRTSQPFCNRIDVVSLPVVSFMREISIIDRGRGPQLSTNRITVQDLVPYLKRHCSHEEIRQVMPVLTAEEIAIVEQYIREHFEEVMEQDRRIEQRTAE